MKEVKTDILILGSGAAGVAAAIAASRKGLGVTVIEKNSFPGGKATASAVGTICGLFLRSTDSSTKMIHRGFVKEFSEAIQHKSHSKVDTNNKGLKYLPYDVDAFRELCLDMMNSNNINYLHNSVITSVYAEGKNISTVVVQNEEGLIKFEIKALIDCSGNAVISELAGLEMITSEKYQSAAQVFTVKGITSSETFNIDFSIKRASISNDDPELKDYLKGTSVVPGSLKENSVMLKMGIPLNVTGNAEALKEISKIAASKVKAVFNYLKTNVESFSNSTLESMAPEVGFRVQQRPVGNYILSGDDVRNCVKHTEGITCGTWPMEIWELGYKVNMEYFNENDFYHIPAGCLESKFLDNLFMAGRNISADSEAIASARVIGTCLATGSAAGMLAAGKLNQIDRNTTIKDIRHTMFTSSQVEH